MEHFPAPLSAEQSDAFVERIERTFDEKGFGLWVLENRRTHEFLGYAGLWPANFEAPFAPATEVGWRLARRHWGHGYATEGARAAMDHGFSEVGLDEIVSFTASVNVRSVRVMERLGMVRDPAGDFEHPAIQEGSPLRRHVLYRISAETWGVHQPSVRTAPR